MKHLFISYELALLAKEKGFDEPCLCSYNNDNDEKEFNFFPYYYTIPIKTSQLQSNKGMKTDITAPLYQQLIDWFREKHNLFIEVSNFLTNENIVTYDYCISYCDADIDEKGNMPYLIDYDINRTFNYYEAMTKAIEEAFKLIP